jgi:hypothetical protein
VVGKDSDGDSKDAPTLVALGGALWALRYTPSLPGSFELSVTADGVSAAPLLVCGTTEARSTSAQACKITGEDGQVVTTAQVQAGKPLVLKLQRRDASGRPVRRHVGEVRYCFAASCFVVAMFQLLR